MKNHSITAAQADVVAGRGVGDLLRHVPLALTRNRPWEMRSVEEYLNNAAEFEKLAADPANTALKARYADLAACYRLLAEERKRLIESGELLTNQSD